MQVNVRNGKPVVKLTKKEEKALSDADHVLDLLHRFGECSDSAGAANRLEVVMRKFGIPISEKIEGADASSEQKESEVQPPSEGIEGRVQGSVPYVPGSELRVESAGAARSRKKIDDKAIVS